MTHQRTSKARYAFSSDAAHHKHSFLSSRGNKAMISLLGASIAAIAVYLLADHRHEASRSITKSSSTHNHSSNPAAPSTPPNATHEEPSLNIPHAPTITSSTQLPVIVTSLPLSNVQLLSQHTVLNTMQRYGLPALPFHDVRARYAYPLIVRSTYIAAYNHRSRMPDWCIETLTANKKRHASLKTDTSVDVNHISSEAAQDLASADDESAVEIETEHVVVDTKIDVASTSSNSSLVPVDSLSVALKSERSRASFHADPLLIEKQRAHVQDFAHTIYDRGHLIPAADAKMSQDAMNDTFVMTNIAAQHRDLNRGWWRALEEFTRGLTKCSASASASRSTPCFSRVTVITGPLILPDVGSNVVSYEMLPVKKPQVAVPTHFFKLFLCEFDELADSNRSHMDPVLTSFIVPNKPIPESYSLSRFVVPLSQVEQASGWQFFPLAPNSANAPTLCSFVACDLQQQHRKLAALDKKFDKIKKRGNNNHTQQHNRVDQQQLEQHDRADRDAGVRAGSGDPTSQNNQPA